MKYSSQKRVTSTEFPDVTFVLKKMTEGRRIDLRSQMVAPQKRIRDILRAQSDIENSIKKILETDVMTNVDAQNANYRDLQDELDEINRIWIQWGLKSIEGLEVDDKTLTIDDWKDWPSGLIHEAVAAVQEESQLDGLERKNSELPTTSGELVGGVPSNSNAPSAKEKAGGSPATVVSISPNT